MADDTNTYELTYILNPVISDDHTKNLVRRVNKFVEEHGGSVIEVDEWGNQRFSYTIEKKRSGHYVNMFFKGPGELIQQLERALRIEDNVLRWVVIRMDQKHRAHYEERKRKEAESAEAEEVEEGDDG